MNSILPSCFSQTNFIADKKELRTITFSQTDGTTIQLILTIERGCNANGVTFSLQTVDGLEFGIFEIKKVFCSKRKFSYLSIDIVMNYSIDYPVQIKGIGTFLTELGFYQSIQDPDCKGHCEFMTIRDAFFFYWQMGFRLNPYFFRRPCYNLHTLFAAKFYESNKSNPNALKKYAERVPNFKMFLPSNAMPEFKKKVEFKFTLMNAVHCLPYSIFELCYKYSK